MLVCALSILHLTVCSLLFNHPQNPSTIQTIYPERRMTMQEHSGATTMKGNPLTLVGPELSIGDSAPDVEVLGTVQYRQLVKEVS